MKVVGVIPERMNSSRFPGKPLALICDKPMVQHVYENSKECKLLDELFVATGDKPIIDCVKGFGGDVIVTRDDHFRASNQVAEAISGVDCDIVCMIQGDEPMVNSNMIRESVMPLINDNDIVVTNLMEQLCNVGDRNEIKVVVDKYNFALYFSRSDIPFGCKDLFKQVCVISYRKNILELFPRLDETVLERFESVDMLRFLENDIRVKMVPVDYATFSVDTPQDLEHVESLLKGDR